MMLCEMLALVFFAVYVEIISSVPFDPFIDFALKHRSSVVPPCTNFYRHVCPVSTLANETAKAILIAEKRDRHANACKDYIAADRIWDLTRALTVSLDDKDRELQRVDFYLNELRWTCGMNSTCWMEAKKNIDRVHRYTGSAAPRTVPQNITQLRDTIRSMYTGYVFKELRTWPAINMLRNVLLNKCLYAKTISGAADRFRGQYKITSFYLELIEAARRRILGFIQKVNPMKNPNARMLGEFLENTFVHTPFDPFTHNANFIDTIYQIYNDAYDQLLSSRALIDAKLTLSRALMRIEEYLKEISFPQVYTELRDFNVFNAYNTMGRLVTLVDLSGYLFSRENITVPTRYATAGRVLGHELGHSFITPRFHGVAEKCTIDHYKEVCDLFKEQSCKSGALTFYEDSADSFGIRVAYDAFEHRNSEAFLKELMSGADITNAQAFFYALGAFYCSTVSGSQHFGNEVHSSTIARVNGMVRGFPEFQNAFNCKLGDPMYIPNEQRCDIFEGSDYVPPSKESLSEVPASFTSNLNITILGGGETVQFDFSRLRSNDD